MGAGRPLRVLPLGGDHQLIAGVRECVSCGTRHSLMAQSGAVGWLVRDADLGAVSIRC